jgi:hypothetical protein
LPIDTNDSSGESGRPGGSAGFSRNASSLRPSPVWITPNELAVLRGTRMPATVTPAPDSMCWSIICRGSIR